MSDRNLLEALGQVASENAGDVFRGYLRGCVREMLCQVMAEEVTELCGPKHHPNNGEHQRAGSSPGRFFHEGTQQEVARPRVRKQLPDGGTEEVRLATYDAAGDSAQLQDSILAAVSAGVSGREVKDVAPESSGVSKSSVSRLWTRAGHRFVNELRERDLSQKNWLVLMLDGIRLSKDQLAIVAIGITTDGKKVVLDFELGSTENAEVCKELLRRLIRRGFACRRRLLAVLDGSDALRGAVKTFFEDAVIQRCLVHKERNLRAKLSKRDWGELSRLFTRLRQVEGREAGEEVFAEMEVFLLGKNSSALESFREAGDDLIAVHRLDVPSTLHRNLLSTNAIENSFRNTRRKLGRVTRFRPETDQASRWLAYALLSAEKGFRRISGWKDLPRLAAALERPSQDAPQTSPSVPKKSSERKENP